MTEEIIEKAIRLRRKYGRNIYKALEDMNVSFFRKNLEASPAFTTPLGEQHIIIISDELNEFEEIFILSHELGHILLHDNLDRKMIHFFDNSNKYEFQANLFAVIFNGFSYQDAKKDDIIQKTINYIIYYLSSCKLDNIYLID